MFSRISGFHNTPEIDFRKSNSVVMNDLYYHSESTDLQRSLYEKGQDFINNIDNQILGLQLIKQGMKENPTEPPLDLKTLMDELHPGTTTVFQNDIWQITIPTKKDTSLFSIKWYRVSRDHKIHICGMHPPKNQRDRIGLLWMHMWFKQFSYELP